MRIVGIDVGKIVRIGSIEFTEIGPPKVVGVWEVDAFPGKRDVCAPARSIGSIVRQQLPHRVWVEQQQPYPKQGVSSTFKLGYAFATVIGGLASTPSGVSLVTPIAWKRQLGLIHADKEKSRLAALTLFGENENLLARKKDHDRAEALLIAYYGMLQLRGEALGVRRVS